MSELLVVVRAYGEATAQVKRHRGTAEFNQAYERAAELRQQCSERQKALSEHEHHGCAEIATRRPIAEL